MSVISEQPTNAFQILKNTNVTSGAVVLKLGTNYLWIDATGDLRIDGANPTSDTAGTIVGTQA